ncbi:MAG: tRNA (N6-isopentenyl adenosine(37)-C2)-methylthiotransferase MiaB [Alphaproteobacteria bacterium]
MKKLYIKTYGCQMNTYDSSRISDLLAMHGYSLSDKVEEANIAVLNTCHIREKATEKVFSELGRLNPLKQKKLKAGEEGLLVVAGCVAQAEGPEIMRRAPYVDVVVGPQSYHQLPELIERAKRRQRQTSSEPVVIQTDFPVESKFDTLPLPEGNGKYAALLSIQEGCDKFCTFCVVPYTRGAEYSRPVADILKEAKHLVSQGVQEITLLGQNVNAYHGISALGSEMGLGALCLELAEIDGLERIRYTTSHPLDMDQVLIKAHASCGKLMPFIHLPVQSGSNRVLKDMNRKHTVEKYREIIAAFRAERPEIAFSSDFIVGFPGESDKDFEDTMKLVEDIKYSQAFSFKYSPRPGTPASVLDMQVPEEVKDARLLRLQKLLYDQQKTFNESFINKSLEVLIEKKGDVSGHYLGKSPFMQSVVLESKSDILGKTVQVQIIKAGYKMLEGKLL